MNQEHYEKLKKDRKALRKKTKEQRDLIKEMIDFMDKQGVKHDFKTPEELHIEEDSVNQFTFTVNGENKVIKTRQQQTFLSESEIEKRLQRLTDKRKRDAV